MFNFINNDAMPLSDSVEEENVKVDERVTTSAAP